MRTARADLHSCGVQVYRGTLRSNGQAVAVKVQRPGVREQIAMDVFILRNLLALIREWRKVNRCALCQCSRGSHAADMLGAQRHTGEDNLQQLSCPHELADSVRSNLPALLDEWAGSLFRELDYRQEADNGARFKALYGALDRVFVPGMHRDLTTQRVLVMEWVTGRRLRTSSEGSHRLAAAPVER